MSPTVFRFVTAIERFAKEKGLEVDYRNDIEDPYIELCFRDSVYKHHQSIAKVICSEIFHHYDDLYAFANRIVDMTVREIEKLKKEEESKAHRMYISPGRSSGKTLMMKNFYSPEVLAQYNSIYERIKSTMINSVYGIPKNTIKDVIFNPPATIVMWKDGTKTVVKAQNDEAFDPEKGLAMAIAKKALGNQGNYFETIKKYTETYKKPEKQKVVSDIPKSEGERWCIFHHGYGWIKGRKYVRVMGKKIFHDYIYTNDESEAMTWKTKHGAEKNTLGLRSATVLKF